MVIYNAKIITMTGAIFEKGYIKLNGNKIEEVGDMAHLTTAILGDAIDADGMTLYPGFIDAHAHIGMFGEGIDFEGADGNEETDPVTPHLRAIDSINPLDISFKEAIHAGVTTVITGVGSANPMGGSFVVMKTAGSRRVDDLIIKSPLCIKFALGENPKTVYNAKEQFPSTRMATAAIIREHLAKAKRYLDDVNKHNETLGTDDEVDLPEYDIKMEALIPLFQKKLQAHFHCHRADDIFTAIRLAEEFDLDYVLIHCTEGAIIAEDLAQILGTTRAKIVLGPLLGSRSKPELANMTIESPKVLNDYGLRFAICTDHPEVPIQYLPLSGAIAVRGGLPAEKAIEAITRNAAEVCGIIDSVGTLESGKDADIVGFVGNPLDVTNTPKLVICNGKIVVNKVK